VRTPSSRLAALVACVALLSVTIVFCIKVHYPTVLPRRDCIGLAVVGIVVGWVLGVVVRYALRIPLDRRLIVPWGTAGGSIFLIVAAWQMSELGPVRYFLAGIIAAILLASLGLRMFVAAIRGPLDDTPAWAAKPKRGS
jgi:hypothetical protein